MTTHVRHGLSSSAAIITKSRAALISALLTLSFLISSPAYAMVTFVRLPSGSNIALDLEPSDTILNVKQKILDSQGFLPEQQTLYYAGNLLENGLTLSDYNISGSSLLFLYLLSAEPAKEKIDREKIRLKCLAEVLADLKAQKIPPFNTLQCAEFDGVQSSNHALIAQKLLDLNEESRADLVKIKATVKRVVIIEKLSNAEISRNIYASDLVDIGAFEKGDPNRSSVTALLRKLPATEIDTFEEVQSAILRQKLVIKDRKDRLSQLQDRLSKKAIL